MIRKFRLRGFQKHKDQTFRLGKVTTFQGPSHLGKSSALRGLKFLALNTPPRGEYINFGCDATHLELFVDKHVIGRKKGRKGGNVYTLDKKKFRAVGLSAPPEAIKKVLRLSEANFQSQISLPYWFSDTPGEVSRQLNQIINLTEIDNALSNIVSMVKEAKLTVKISENRLEDLKDRSAELDWVDEFDAILCKAEATKAKLDRNEESRVELLSLCESVRKHRTVIGDALNAKAAAERAVKTGERLVKNELRIEKLKSLIKEIKKQERIKSVPIPDLSKLESLMDRFNENAERQLALRNLIAEIKDQERLLWEANENVKNGKRKLQKLTNGKCPVCGGRLKS